MTKSATTTDSTEANLLPEAIYISLLQSLADEAPSKLPYRFVSVQGPQALQALQGQLSCDLNKLEAGELSFGTANTPKGRMYALFRITPWREGFLLCLGDSVVDAFVTHISKYLHFFKCEIQLESEIEALVCEQGLLVEQHNSAIEAAWPLPKLNFEASNLEDQPTTETPELEERWVNTSSITKNSELWPAYQCALGIPELYPDTLEYYILQQLNLQN